MAPRLVYCLFRPRMQFLISEPSSLATLLSPRRRLLVETAVLTVVMGHCVIVPVPRLHDECVRTLEKKMVRNVSD